MYTKNEHILEYPNYTSINDFKESLIYGREIIIKWKNIEYSLEYENNSMSDFSICEANKPKTENHFNSFDDLLEYTINTGELLKDIILNCEIVWRNI